MRLVYKGVYKDESQLPKGNLPHNAVKFIESKNPSELFVATLFCTLPILFIIMLFVICNMLLYNGFPTAGDMLYLIVNNIGGMLLGFIVSFLFLIPNVLLRSICFGKNAEVELFLAPSQLMLFAVSVEPITKARFICLSSLPSLAFGWIPLLIWTIIPYSEVSAFLFSFACFSILFGVGDYLNIVNAIRQMPKGSMQQLSGFNSYWFIP